MQKKTYKSDDIPGVVAHAFNLSTWEVEVGKSGAQGPSQLHSKVKDLGYLIPGLKK